MQTNPLILAVDDEKDVCQLMKRILESVGYEVIMATDGQEALDKMSQLKIEVVLLDIKMPGMSGMEVLGKLTADYPDICVVMATAVTDTQTAVKAMKLGAYDYITKPFNADDLVLTVRRAIERRDLQLQRRHYQFELQQSVKEQAERLRTQFEELVLTLAREHKLLYELEITHGAKDGVSSLSKLPQELQKPMSSVEEFREALLRILQRV